MLPATPPPSTAASPAPSAPGVAGAPATSPPVVAPKTLSRTGVHRPSLRYSSAEYPPVASTSEPSPIPASVRAALRDPHWLAVMQDEFAAL
jgi:hypothetical protein